MIAALYVQPEGAYWNLPGVDPWDESRDARTYRGPWPVIAHPPCQRWGRYWSGGPSVCERRLKGDDDGCFASAMASVEIWGGVLEQPEASHAFRWYGLAKPPRRGGWIQSRFGWVCCVEQGHYGHAARKATWIYLVSRSLAYQPPELIWGPSAAGVRLDAGFHSAEERRRAIKTGICQRLSARQRAATPIPFRDLLIALVRAGANFS